MFRTTCQIDFCYGHRLLDYDGKCKHLHGHNGRAVIVLEAAQLDRLGMVLDFAEVKSVIGQWIDQTLDHRMILDRNDPATAVLRQLGEPVHAIDVSPTAENLARLIRDFALEQGYPVVRVDLWETPRCCASCYATGHDESRPRNKNSPGGP